MFRKLLPLPNKGKAVLISNIEIIPGKKIISHLGMVQGNTVRAKHVGRDIMAGFKNIFGGELIGYTEGFDNLTFRDLSN